MSNPLVSKTTVDDPELFKSRTAADVLRQIGLIIDQEGSRMDDDWENDSENLGPRLVKKIKAMKEKADSSKAEASDQRSVVSAQRALITDFRRKYPQASTDEMFKSLKAEHPQLFRD